MPTFDVVLTSIATVGFPIVFCVLQYLQANTIIASNTAATKDLAKAVESLQVLISSSKE